MSYSNCLRFPSEGSGVEVSSLTPFTSSSSLSSGNIVYNKDFQIYDTQRGGNQPSRNLKTRAPTSSPQYIRFRNQSHSQQSDSSEVRSFHNNQQEQVLQTYTQGQPIGSENYKWQALPNNTTGYCMQPSYDQSTDGHSYPVVAYPSGSDETAFALANSSEYSCALPSLRVEQITGAQFYNSYPPPLPTTTSSWQFQNGYYQPDHPSSTITSKAYPFNTLLAPHKAMQVFAADRQYLDDAVPEFGHSSRHSMSSMGNASPATPPTLDDNVDDPVVVNTSSNPAHPYAGNRAHSHLQLFRTESQAFQDELYNPSQEQPTPKPTAKPTSTYVSPRQTVMSERLQAANNIRSQSPGSVMSRDRSPFRDNSPYAAHVDWRSPAGMGTAASMRKYLKEQTEQAEYAQLMPKLKREPTKTMSPKDAMLDGNDGDQPSLFQDSIPMGYKQHNTGESWFQNMSSETNTSFRPMQPMPAVTMSFRPDTTTTLPADTFSFGNMVQPTFSGASVPAVALNRVRSNQYLAPADATPHFPPTLTSMESSISDNGPSSSADSIRPIQRPADTRANTGTYTCTYHGCIERFHSQMELQKHKREVHRTQQYLSAESQSSPRGSTGSSLGDDDASAASNESPRSSASPEPTGSGMTSAALLARNSQAGPHKCTRNNPTTGKPCNTIFSRPYDLTRHEDTIHNNRKEKVRCELCREEKTFSRNDALTRHMRVVHPEVESYGKRGRRD